MPPEAEPELQQLASVAELLARTARTVSAETPAVITGGRAWTYRELHEGANRAAASLQRAGVSPGDNVLLAMPNGAEFFLAFFGTLLAGGVAVPVFPRSTAQRLSSLARLSDARAVIASDVLAPEVLQRLAASAADEGRAFLTPADMGGAGTPENVPLHIDRPCYIQFTSGSTADPRGVIISHRSLLANISQMIEAMDITRSDVFVSWLPTYHDMGLTLMALTPFSLGARLVLLPTDLRDVASWLRAIEANRGTFTAGPDFAYRLCLRNASHAGHAGRFDLSSLQVCMNASEPVRAGTLAAFETAFGLRNVMMAGYGLAEATLSVTCTQRGEPIDADERGLVCLGPPMPGTTVTIIAPDDGELPPGEVGEIVIAGPSNGAGYYRNAAATQQLAWRDDYIRTGDLGKLDAKGRLYFVARQKDLIKVAGRSLYPQEVESIVDELPGIRFSAAVGIDRGGFEGEQLHVFAEVRDSLAPPFLRGTAIEIVRAVHDALGVRPRSTILLRPRRIPVTSNGKLQRSRLRDVFIMGDLVPGADIRYPPPITPSPGGG